MGFYSGIGYRVWGGGGALNRRELDGLGHKKDPACCKKAAHG